jgi:hypothetical protein
MGAEYFPNVAPELRDYESWMKLKKIGNRDPGENEACR